jgi:hypothetical protein
MSHIEDWRDKVVYTIIPNRAVTSDLLKKCAELFSNHYGIWSDKGEHKAFIPVFPGSRVKMGPSRLKKDYLFNDRCGLVTAQVGDILIGHVFFTMFYMLPHCEYEVRWVTQLVVHSNYRRQKVAQNLLLHSLGTQAQIFGLVTSHPHAVRALERAMRYKCHNVHPNNVKEILERSGISYLHPSKIGIHCSETQCILNTKFYVNHDETQKALDREIQTNDEISELEKKENTRQQLLARKLNIIEDLERLKTRKSSKARKRRIPMLQNELDQIQKDLDKIGETESINDNEKRLMKWTLGNILPDGHEFLAFIRVPPMIPVPDLPSEAKRGIIAVSGYFQK